MTLTRQTVEHVAKLARLELSEGEQERFAQELSKIVNWVDELNGLNLEAVHVAMASEHPPVFREDALRTPEEAARFEPALLFKNAPHEEDGFFRVPKILEAS